MTYYPAGWVIYQMKGTYVGRGQDEMERKIRVFRFNSENQQRAGKNMEAKRLKRFYGAHTRGSTLSLAITWLFNPFASMFLAE
jgi:hypothetical protein